MLRSVLLRPFETPEELVYHGDDDADTLHAGLFVDGILSGIASVCREPMPDDADQRAWRLRGMAVRPELQGRGYGRALLERCLDHVLSGGGTLLWCNGRVSAAGFYRTLGFDVVDEPFEIPGTGPHYLMMRAVGD